MILKCFYSLKFLTFLLNFSGQVDMLSWCSKHFINQDWSDGGGYFNQSHYGDGHHGVNISSSVAWSLAAQHTAKTVTERFIENSFASAAAARLGNDLAGINRRMLIANSKCEEGAGNNQNIHKDTTFLCSKVYKKEDLRLFWLLNFMKQFAFS